MIAFIVKVTAVSTFYNIINPTSFKVAVETLLVKSLLILILTTIYHHEQCFPHHPHLLPPLSHVEIIPQESIDFSKLHLYPPTAAEGGAAHCFPTPPPHPVEQFPAPPTQDQQAMFYGDGCMDTMIVAMEHPSPNGDFEEFSPQPKYISL